MQPLITGYDTLGYYHYQEFIILYGAPLQILSIPGIISSCLRPTMTSSRHDKGANKIPNKLNSNTQLTIGPYYEVLHLRHSTGTTESPEHF